MQERASVSVIDERVKSFERDGFIGPIRLYQPEEARSILKEVRARAQDLGHALYPDSPVNYDRHFDIPELSRHVTHPEAVRHLRALLGPDVLCWRTEWFPKFPGSEGTEWHAVRDYSYASGVPQIVPTDETQDSCFDLTVWTTFTESTRENGCMKFIPGSHKRELFDERKEARTGRSVGYNALDAGTAFFGYRFAEFKIDPSWDPDSEEVVSLEMDAGECVIFTARCVHGSWPNTSQRKTRFAIASRYVPTHVRIYADQERFMAHGSVHDLARYGAVLVSGEDRFAHNRRRRLNNHGDWFARLDAKVEICELAIDELEQEIERIWRKILKLDEFSRDEDFFDLGGYSALVVHVKSELEATLGRELPIEIFFRHSTVRELAAQVRALIVIGL
jgi:non-haem Fe2+, alpha-ketoglutarate-dependent halogenase